MTTLLTYSRFNFLSKKHGVYSLRKRLVVSVPKQDSFSNFKELKELYSKLEQTNKSLFDLFPLQLEQKQNVAFKHKKVKKELELIYKTSRNGGKDGVDWEVEKYYSEYLNPHLCCNLTSEEIVRKVNEIEPSSNSNKVKETLYCQNEPGIKFKICDPKKVDNWCRGQEHVYFISDLSPTITIGRLYLYLKQIFKNNMSGVELTENFKTIKSDFLPASIVNYKSLIDSFPLISAILKSYKNNELIGRQIIDLYFNSFDKWPSTRRPHKTNKDALKTKLNKNSKNNNKNNNKINNKNNKKNKIDKKTEKQREMPIENFWENRSRILSHLFSRLDPGIKRKVFEFWHSAKAAAFTVLHKKWESLVVPHSRHDEGSAGEKGFSKANTIEFATPFGFSNWSSYKFFGYKENIPFTKQISLPGVGEIYVLRDDLFKIMKVRVYRSPEGRTLVERQTTNTKRLDKLIDKRLRGWEPVDHFFSMWERSYGAEKVGIARREDYNKRSGYLYLKSDIMAEQKFLATCSLGLKIGQSSCHFQRVDSALVLKFKMLFVDSRQMRDDIKNDLKSAGIRNFKIFIKNDHLKITFSNLGDARKGMIIIDKKNLGHVNWYRGVNKIESAKKSPPLEEVPE